MGACARPNGPACGHVLRMGCAGSGEQLGGGRGHGGLPAELLSQDDAQAGLLGGSLIILLVILQAWAERLCAEEVQAPPLLLLVGAF